jgi:aryl-alcohol dehydrogenase-like predicted oxidoreductase
MDKWNEDQLNVEARLIQKVTLGTVQFGLDYGIANKKGKIPKAEAFDILDYAAQVGIELLDTAYAYGESEQTIGEYTHSKGERFKIISKLPALGEQYIPGKAEKILLDSLLRLKVKRIHGYLLHSFADFRDIPRLWEELEGLRRKNLVQYLGFSLYGVDELDAILKRDVTFDMVQVPYSVFDRRFEVYFPELRKREIEIQARSVFLQGLAFIHPEELPPHLRKAKGYLSHLRDISQEASFPIPALCLDFVLYNPYVDRVIIGVDSLEHLKNNINHLAYSSKIQTIVDQLQTVAMEDEDILLPYKWPAFRQAGSKT